MNIKDAMIISDILDRFTYNINQKMDKDRCIHYSEIIRIKNKLIKDITLDDASHANSEEYNVDFCGDGK